MTTQLSLTSGSLRGWRPAMCFAVLSVSIAVAQQTASPDSPEPAADKSSASNQQAGADEDATPLVPLNEQGTVLLDKAGNRLLLKGRIALREGLLEMLLCKAHTKEHESIIAVDSDAYVIHAGLLALGAKPGTPVQYEPEFKPPTGQKIGIFVNWKDEAGKEHRVPAARWVRTVTRRYYGEPLAKLPATVNIPEESELRYDEKHRELSWFGQMSEAERDALLAMSDDKAWRQAIRNFYRRSQPAGLDADWVFAGSGFYTQMDGTRWYQAESGNVVCVANFGDAMIDVSIRSSAENSDLLFEPWTERIPPLGAPVEVELVPLAEEDAAGADEGE